MKSMGHAKERLLNIAGKKKGNGGEGGRVGLPRLHVQPRQSTSTTS